VDGLLLTKLHVEPLEAVSRLSTVCASLVSPLRAMLASLGCGRRIKSNSEPAKILRFLLGWRAREDLSGRFFHRKATDP
jgi:hypothetical protein